MSRYYVGIAKGPNLYARRVFSSANEPEAKIHGSIYSAVIGPFRTRKAAYLMAEYGANNPHMQSVSDAEKLVRQNLIEFQTLYVASAWWSDCDTFVTVAGNSARLVERTVYKAMRDAAIDAYNSSEPEDKRTVRSYMREIHWSGVNAFAFDSIIPDSVVSQYEDAYKTDAQFVAHHPCMDYSDYEMLRDGRKDVTVYL